MPLSHILNAIYSTKENHMDVINATIQKGEVPKKGESSRKKSVQNFYTEEVKA